MKPKVICLILLFSISPLQGQEQAETSKPSLSFQQFLQTTLEFDPSFQRILLRRLYLKYAKDLGMPAADLLLEIQGEYGIFRDTDEGVTATDPGATVTLKKLFPYSGTEAEVSYSKISNATTSVNRYQSTLGVQISQEVLRNSFGRATRMLGRQIDIQTSIARYQVVESYEDYLAYLLVIYLDWFRAEKRKAAAEKTLEEEKQVYRLTLRKRRLRVAYDDEVQTARLAVKVAEAALEAARAEEKNRKIKIGQLMGKTSEEFGESVAVDFDQSFTPADPKEISRTEKVLKLLEKEGILETEIAADNLLPSAKLFAGYELFSSEFSLARPDHYLYFGASVDFNFTRQVERARHKVSLLDQQDIKLSNKKSILNLKTDWQIIDNHVQSIGRIVGLAEERLEIANTIARQVQRRYSLGQSDITDLANARRSLVQARVNLIEQLANQAELRLEQLRLKDSLVHRLPGKKQVSEK